MPSDPLFLTTAIEAVVRAGDLQMARFGHDIRVDKKGIIDLVTEIDVAVERMFRDLIADRFPDHAVLAEELGGTASTASRGPCWVFDPIDGTTNYAHGLPIFCASLALEIDGVAQVAAIYDPTRRELFTAERGAGAFLNGGALRVSSAQTLVDALLVTGFPYDVHDRIDEIVGLFGAFVGRARAVRRLGSAAIDLCYVAAGRMDGFWESDLKPWDIAAGGLIVALRRGSNAGVPMASAQQSLNLYIGGFTPRAEDARNGDDVLVQNRDFLVFNTNDFNGGTFGGDWLIALGDKFDAGLGLGFYQRTVPTVYTAFLNSNGSEIEADLKLRVVPFTATVRLLPFGHHAAIQPYIGGGVGVFAWRYSETGQFVDFSTSAHTIFRGNFVGSGSQAGPVVLGGVRVPMGPIAVGGEIRYQSAEDTLPADQSFAGSKIDLGGLSYLFTFNIRF